MKPRETTPKVNDGSNSKKEATLPMQASERTFEDSESTVPEEGTAALQEARPPSAATTNSRPEQRKSISLQQELPSAVNNSTIQQSTRSGISSLVDSNITPVGGMSAKEVSSLPNAIVPLRGILDGGLNLGDSHLTNHSKLPKRKQNRPRMPSEVDSFFTAPQNPTKPNLGVTLGDTNQYSVPKTIPRIQRENPELGNFLQDTMNSSGVSSMTSAPEREPYGFTINNTPSNNAMGNLVEGLPGRVSFLTKQNASSKGAVEGGISAINVSKRPKQNGASRRALVSAPSDVSGQNVGNMISREPWQPTMDNYGGSIQSHPKAKDIKIRSLSDPSEFTSTELELPISETVREIIPKPSYIPAEGATNQQDARQLSHNSEGIVQFRLDPASVIPTGKLGGDPQPTASDQKANNHTNHEGLAVPKRMLRKGDSRSEKDDFNKLTNQNDGVVPKVTNVQSHPMQQNNINRSYTYKPLQGDLTPNHSDVVSTRNNDVTKITSGGSSVPKATSQRDNAVKKNPKLMVAQNVSTPQASGPENKEAPPREVAECLKTKRNPVLTKSDSEKNQGNKDNTFAPNVTRKGHASKPPSQAKEKQESSSKMDEPLGLTQSSSIIDLPVPDHFK